MNNVESDDDDSDVSESEVGASFEGSSEEMESSTDEFREVRNLTKRETKDVEMWRDLVTGVLVITACFVTTASFIYLSREETQTFKLAFGQYVTTIKDSAIDMERGIQDGFEAVTDSITAHAQTTDSQWPFVTVPFFEVHGHHARDIAHVDVFSLCPLVMEDNRAEWETYSVENQWWLQGDQIVAYTEQQEAAVVNDANNSIPGHIYRIEDGFPTVELGAPPYAPRWQMSPPPSDLLFINYDVISPLEIKSLYYAMVAGNGPVMSNVLAEDHSLPKTISKTTNDPSSLLLYPVYETFNYTATEIVGFLEILFNWKNFVSNLLPEGEGGVYYVINSTCGDEFSFQGSRGETIYIGEGDHHDPIYDRHVAYVELVTPGSDHPRPCVYGMLVYPSAELRAEFSSNIPGVFTGIVAGAFFLMAFFFFAYDKFVQRRNDKVVRQAAKTNAIVSSLFPTNVRDRLFGNNDGGTVKSGKSGMTSRSGGRSRLKNFLSDGSTDDKGRGVDEDADRPIADLFPNCTVLFADIVGFTAWSSMREPTQVFRLLEAMNAAFDEIAKRRKVFKVETIGDCYVAVTGLPEPNKHHALTMAKFSRDCMYKMHEVTRNLEVSLGPDTGDLSMRIGLHSGPVTAGVLRGERSRFQLFGDTVNTASRIESTGTRGCIHLSQEAAHEISASGKALWVKERLDKVTAKGKGEMTTFWLSLTDNSSAGDGQSSCGDSGIRDAKDVSTGRKNAKVGNEKKQVQSHDKGLSEKNERLVEWNVDILQRLLKQIAAKRQVTEGAKSSMVRAASSALSNSAEQPLEHAKHQMVLDEVVEVICLPKFTSRVAGVVVRAEDVALSSEVLLQLHDYVASIASMYNDNPFHNFEHASHVTMSVVKLLSRIVAPDDVEVDENEFTNEKKLMKSIASKMHDHTYGITSDPLTQFAVVFLGSSMMLTMLEFQTPS